MTDKDLFLVDLISSEGNIHKKDEDGQTILFYKSTQRLGFLKTLVKFGLNINEPDIYGKTPLFYCQDVDIFNEMLNCGADINHRDNTGRSVAFYYHNEDILDVILNHPETDYNLKSNDGGSILSDSLFSYYPDIIMKYKHRFNFKEVLITKISCNEPQLLITILSNGFTFELAKKVLLGYPPEHNPVGLEKLLDIILKFKTLDYRKSVFYFVEYNDIPAKIYTLKDLYKIVENNKETIA